MGAVPNQWTELLFWVALLCSVSCVLVTLAFIMRFIALKLSMNTHNDITTQVLCIGTLGLYCSGNEARVSFPDPQARVMPIVN